MIKKESKGYSATVIADSISESGKRITTFELIYPRLIHSELMTHRLFSRNAASSRAIPVQKLIDMVRINPAAPYRFGQHQSGMQDQGVEFDGIVKAFSLEISGREFWNMCAEEAADNAQALYEAGFAKQVCNRLLEPFQFMKTVLTSTEFDNYYWLRLDKDADPSIEFLASLMKEAHEDSTPELLKAGEWHTPYVDHVRVENANGTSVLKYLAEGDTEVSLEEAKAISSSCCAQVSYRILNKHKEKALDIYGRLLNGAKVHASPFEHQASPMHTPDISNGADAFGTLLSYKGYTHLDKNGDFWSGNFCGFIQHRQLLDNHTVW